MNDFGVLYAVDQNPAFRAMAEISLSSLRRYHPDWPVHVADLPSPRVSGLLQAYRRLSFWKAGKRRDRANQDVRVIASKTRAMLESPFRLTLFIDADTVVMRALHDMREAAESADVLATAMPWKRYARAATWQPESWPYVMSGVVFYNERFRERYRAYVERVGDDIVRMPTQDQFVFSLACACESTSLRIVAEPQLQVDVLNFTQHVGAGVSTGDPGIVDLRDPRLSGFRVFHYNEHKPQYLAAIRDVWGLG
jgi:hypothetical protein